jgi:hypothetical protein
VALGGLFLAYFALYVGSLVFFSEHLVPFALVVGLTATVAACVVLCCQKTHEPRTLATTWMRYGLTAVAVSVPCAWFVYPACQLVRKSEVNLDLANRMKPVGAALLAYADEPVVWTRPDDLAFVPNGAVPRLLTVPAFESRQARHVILGDGSWRTLDQDLLEEELKALLTRNGGEPLPRNWD